MPRRHTKALRTALILLPVVTGGLWLISGRETLTKPSRAVEVQLEDALFGDIIPETRFVSGPIFGYYVGLDAVVVTFALMMTLLTVAGLLRWIRRPDRGKCSEEWN